MSWHHGHHSAWSLAHGVLRAVGALCMVWRVHANTGNSGWMTPLVAHAVTSVTGCTIAWAPLTTHVERASCLPRCTCQSDQLQLAPHRHCSGDFLRTSVHVHFDAQFRCHRNDRVSSGNPRQAHAAPGSGHWEGFCLEHCLTLLLTSIQEGADSLLYETKALVSQP